MTTSYPGSLDTFRPGQILTDGSSIITTAPHNNLMDAVDALQAKVGANGSTVATSLDFALKRAYIKVSHQVVNADGGGSTAATWVKRTINTEDSDAGNLCAIASSQITLAAGTYRCRITCPAFAIGYHAARLQNVTDGTTLLMGTCEYNNYDGYYAQNRSEIVGEFTVAAAKALEIQHLTQVTRAGNGFGFKAFTLTTPNVYTVAEFWKIS